jgi:hypothetical protein
MKVMVTMPRTTLEACQFQETRQLQESPVANGQCPNSGNQLDKTMHGDFKESSEKIRPMMIKRQVSHGECLPCLLYVSQVIPTQDKALEYPFEEVFPVETSDTYHGDCNTCGERHGEGVLTWSNGDVYIGQFFRGQRHGQGTLTFADGGEYVGEWSDNLMDGRGTRWYENGSVYLGQYQRGHRHGKGQCHFANEDYYEGEWHQDEIEGYGRYYYNHGHVYEEWFVKGQRHGMGKYQYGSGVLDIHNFENDTRVGEGCRWSANREKAWRTYNGVVRGRITLQAASDMVSRIQKKGLKT